MSRWKYFKDAEVKGLHHQLVAMLDDARAIAGIPFVITSGYRSPSRNGNAGGVKNSAHESGKAVDLRAPNSKIRKKIVDALREVGFVRIGTYSAHVHCDIDASKPQIAWNGGASHA